MERDFKSGGITLMAITNTTKQAAFVQDTDEIFLALLTIDHADLSSTIRVVNNNVDITSNSNTFTAFPFRLQLPDQKPDAAPRASLIIDNVSREIAQAIRSISTPATVLIQIIRAGDPDTIEKTFATFNLRNVRWNASSVSGDLVLEEMEKEPFPAGEFSPAEFPSMF
jgi:hypothetical protein